MDGSEDQVRNDGEEATLTWMEEKDNNERILNHGRYSSNSSDCSTLQCFGLHTTLKINWFDIQT